MRRFVLIAALLITSLASAQRRAVLPPRAPQRVIIPFGGLFSVTTGVPNEAWYALATIHNPGIAPLNVSSYFGCSFDPCTPTVVTYDIAAGQSRIAGASIFQVNSGSAAFSVRVDDVTARPGFQWSYAPSGIEVPAIREAELRRSVLLENVPADTPWNTFLYLYSTDAKGGIVTVSVLDSSLEGEPLETFQLTLAPAAFLHNFEFAPAYGSADIVDHLKSFGSRNFSHDVALRIDSPVPIAAFVIVHDSVAHKLGIVSPPR